MSNGRLKEWSVGAVGIVAVGLIVWSGLRDEGDKERAVDASQAEPSAQASAPPSADLMPLELAGVYLGMSRDELTKVRSQAKLNSEAASGGRIVLEEGLRGGRRALYIIHDATGQLERVQVASRLGGVGDIEPRLVAARQRLGRGLAMWDCPAAANMAPTRRFTWFKQDVGIMDSYLVTGDSVSATEMIAPAVTVRALLAAAQCQPAPPERLSRFPSMPAPTDDTSRPAEGNAR